MKKEIRLRFAPSPTGKLHIGGIRTFLFNFLYAKHFDGKIFLRIEDTDKTRNIDNFEKEISYLKKLNLKWDDFFDDGSFYYQSKQLNLYQKIAFELVAKNFAYKCYCTKKELEESKNEQLSRNVKSPKYNEKCRNLSKDQQIELEKTRKFTIRIKREKNIDISFNDLNFSKITINTNDFDDFIILKEDGTPTYNFACVIDDFIMKISHVLRGQEHISNTPKQILIQKYLNYPEITYCHFSVIVDKNGKKLSKRNLSTKQFLSDYLDEGYLPEAIINFLALLGWFPKQKSSEIFVISELISLFNGSNISKNPSYFDDTKLLFFNYSHLKLLNQTDYFNYLKKYSKNFFKIELEKAKKIARYYQNEISIASELDQKLAWFFQKPDYLKEEKEIINNNFFIAKVFKEYLENNNAVVYENLIKFLNIEKKIKKDKNLFFVLRLLLTKTLKGPELKFIFSFYDVNELRNIVAKNFLLIKNDN